ncbi:MAG: hypothetical protein WCC80_14660, partial [Pseudolabrys sp.]
SKSIVRFSSPTVVIGPAAHPPQKQAGHVTAPDQCYLLRPTGNPTFLSLMWLGKSNKFLLRYVKVERCVMW